MFTVRQAHILPCNRRRLPENVPNDQSVTVGLNFSIHIIQINAAFRCVLNLTPNVLVELI